MASGTFTSGRYGGGSHGPWLSLHWTEVEQDISGNRTKLRLTLKFHWSANINYIFYSKSGTLQGSSYTYSGSASGTSGSRTLRTRDVWISHNSDGKKSVTLSGDIKSLGLRWSSVNIGTMTVSGTANLTDIPRKSDLTSVSMTSLQASSAGTLSIGRSVKYSGYYHLVSLYDGSTWIWDTGYFKGNPSTSYTISSTYVNKMLNRMSSVTSKTFRVRLLTYSGNNGSGHIGTSEMNMTVSVHSNVMPSSSVPTASISGTGRDNSIGMYVQNISKVDMNASTWTAGYGASVSTRTLIIRHSSGANVDRREYSGPSATSHVMTRSGTYNIYSRVTDTRGRTFTSNARQITFQAYGPPVITEFTATRNTDKPTEVSIRRYGNHSGLNGNNSATMTITRRQGNGSWSNVVPPISSTGSFGNTTLSYNNSVAHSYEFKVVYEDSFGSKSEATATVSTQRVVLDIHKNEGIGVGKIHEKGVLDVDGEAHFAGDLFVNGVSSSRVADLNEAVSLSSIEDSISFWTNLPQGKYYVRPGEIPNQPKNYGIIDHSSRSGEFNTVWYTQPRGLIYRKSGNHNNNYDWNIIGSNNVPTPIWTGVVYLNNNHTVTPSLSLTNCENGWLLQWSGYIGGKVENTNFSYTFIPRQHGELHSGSGVHQLIGRYNYNMKTKYMYVHNDRIVGNANNNSDGIVLRRIFAC